MRKLLSSLTTLTLIASTTSGTVVACGSHTTQTTKSVINPSTSSTAKKESDQVNNKSVTLNDTASATYESKTAQADTTAIDNAIVAAGYLNATQVKDLSFDNTKSLTTGDNPVKYNVKAPDASTASGTLNVTINPYKPTPPPPPPTPSTAQQEANKIKNQTITLNDTASVTYESKTAQADTTAIDNAIVAAGYLNATQVKDLSFDNTKNLTTGTNSGIGFNVTAPDQSKAKGTFNIVINSYKPTPPTPPTPSSETAQAIADKITNKTVYVNNNLGGSASNPYNEKNILSVLKAINSDNTQDNSKNLSDAETKAISLANVNLTTSLQTVNATIYGANKTTAVVPLQIALNPPLTNHHYTNYFDMGQLFKYNLSDFANKQKIPVITAGFLVHTGPSSNPADPVGWAWGGSGDPIDTNPKQTKSYQALTQYKAAGGKYYISMGGQNGTPGWNSSFHYSVSEIEKSLQYIINVFHPLGLDFDIEGGQASDTAGNTNLFQAVAMLAKTNPNVQFTYTIAVAPDGTEIGPDALNKHFEASFDALLNTSYAPIVNLMTMDYGEPKSDMYQAAIQCVQELSKKILADNKWGLTSMAQVYQHMGITPMIGQNDSPKEVFTKNDLMKVAHYAAMNQMPLLSSWSLTRDNGSAAGSPSASASGSGEYQDPYEFSHLALNTYGDSSQSNEPVAGSLTASNFAVFQDAITIDWKGATNVNYYNVYVDGSPVARVNGQATGYAYHNPNLTQQAHQVKVVAIGAQGSSITSNTFNVDPSKSKLPKPLLPYNPNITYQGQDYVYYHNQVGMIKWYKAPSQTIPADQWEPLGSLSDFTNSLSPSAISDFTNNTLPGWYFTVDPTHSK